MCIAQERRPFPRGRVYPSLVPILTDSVALQGWYPNPNNLMSMWALPYTHTNGVRMMGGLIRSHTLTRAAVRPRMAAHEVQQVQCNAGCIVRWRAAPGAWSLSPPPPRQLKWRTSSRPPTLPSNIYTLGSLTSAGARTVPHRSRSAAVGHTAAGTSALGSLRGAGSMPACCLAAVLASFAGLPSEAGWLCWGCLCRCRAGARYWLDARYSYHTEEWDKCVAKLQCVHASWTMLK